LFLGNHTEADKGKKKESKFEDWLLNKVGLGEYLDMFSGEGFDDLSVIIEIKKESELTELGISKKGHRLKLMRAIRELKGNMQESSEGVAEPATKYV